MKKTKTSSFGVGKRESHDSSSFYGRNLYNDLFTKPITKEEIQKIPVPKPGDWTNKVFYQSSEDMSQVPGNSVALAFTSPPYNVGKDYDGDISL